MYCIQYMTKFHSVCIVEELHCVSATCSTIGQQPLNTFVVCSGVAPPDRMTGMAPRDLANSRIIAQCTGCNFYKEKHKSLHSLKKGNTINFPLLDSIPLAARSLKLAGLGWGYY